jgi:hypothetical protein
MIRATILRNSSRERPQGSGFQFGADFGSEGPEADGPGGCVLLWSYRIWLFMSVQWRAAWPRCLSGCRAKCRRQRAAKRRSIVEEVESRATRLLRRASRIT